MAHKLTIYVTANRLYEPFILPFIATSLLHNPHSHVEVGVEQAEETYRRYAAGFDYIQAHISSAFSLSSVEFSGASPNNVRFLTPPKTRADFIYIGDIDILILESIASWHIQHMKETGQPFSNIKRSGKKALSGLHFSKWDALYPLPDLSDLTNPRTHPDEALLYEIIARHGHEIPSEDKFKRPLHGFHMSLNRRPRKWGIKDKSQQSFLQDRLQAYKILRSDKVWTGLWPHLDISYQRLFALLDYEIEAHAPHIFSAEDGKTYLSRLFFNH